MRGLWQLTWLEIKIFMREPLGAIGSVVFPVVAFVLLGRSAPRAIDVTSAPRTRSSSVFGCCQHGSSAR